MTVPRKSEKSRIANMNPVMSRVAAGGGRWLLDADNDIWLFTNNGAPTSGTSGTGATVTGTASLCLDYLYTALYKNTNTKASPTWTEIAEAGGGGST